MKKYIPKKIAESERKMSEISEKAEKVVHRNLYNKGFRDGLAVLDKLRAEIENIDTSYYSSVNKYWLLEVIDKYKTESNGGNEDYAEVLDNAISSGVLLSTNATNGDAIKALFPNAEFDNAMPFTDNRWETVNLDTKNKTRLRTYADWWNAPYKAVSEGRNEQMDS